MTTHKNRSALQTAMQGGKVSEKAAQSALGHAVERIAALTKKARHSKEAMLETGTVVLHTAETQGSLFLASMAEGYLGDDKLKIGAVDLRGPLGLLAQSPRSSTRARSTCSSSTRASCTWASPRRSASPRPTSR